MWRRLRSSLSGRAGRSQLERDMADELGFHMQARADDLIAAGVDPVEAARRARLDFGAVERVKEECREARGVRWMHDLRADLAYAVRTCRRTPGFALVAVLSIALGVGANALVFSIVNGLILKPLPIEQPDRVFSIQTGTHFGGQSYPNYVDFRDRNTTFAGLAGVRIAPMSVETGGAAPVRAWGYLATGNYFDLLGVRPLVGRVFHQEDDRSPNAAPYAVLSYDEWQSHYGGNPRVVGTTIRINKVPYTIIGVTPRGFYGTEVFYRPALWVPMMMEPSIENGNPWLERRQTMNLWMLGRLKPGVTPQQAEGNLDAIANVLGREYPWPDKGMTLRLTQPGLLGDALRGPVRAFTFGVLALAGLVLLAACANLASLLMARGSDRRREMAIRLSIGAGRGRLVRQLLTEALVLAAAGGACGAALAWGAARLLSAWRVPLVLPVQVDVTVDGRVLLFALAITTAAGLLFGVAPARQAARTDPNAALKGDQTAGAGRRGWPFRDVLVAGQVALCFVLLAACFVSLRGLQRTLLMPLGFRPDGVAAASVDLGLAVYTPAQGHAFQRRALDEIRTLPGVSAAAFANSVPLSLDQSHNVVFPEHPDPATNGRPIGQAVMYEVSPGYFETLGVRLLAGRDFDWHDAASMPQVAVINATFARDILHTGSPVGTRIRFGSGGDLVTIVGMVEDGKYETLTESPDPAVFVPMLQSYNSTTMLLARSSLPPDQMAAALREVVHRLDPALPVYGAGSLRSLLTFAMLPSRLAAVALSAFGLLALTLAATGLYGLVSYAVARRAREIGIRLAIGATRWQVLRVVLGRTLTLLGLGALAGAALSLASGRLLATIVYQASPRDPIVFGAVAVGMLLVGLVACWAPAVRALAIAPSETLRTD